MLATVIICFFVCLLPFRLFTLWLLFSTSQQLTELGMETYYGYLFASRIMLYLNSALNPLLYNLISSKFRAAFLATIRCQASNSPASRLLTRQCTFNTTSSGSGATGSMKQPLGSRLSRQLTMQCSLASSVGSQGSLAGASVTTLNKVRPPTLGSIGELARNPTFKATPIGGSNWPSGAVGCCDSPIGFGSIGSSGSLIDRMNAMHSKGDRSIDSVDGRNSAASGDPAAVPHSMQKLRQQQFRRQYAKQRSLDQGGRIGPALSARKLLHYDQSFDRLFEEDLPFQLANKSIVASRAEHETDVEPIDRRKCNQGQSIGGDSDGQEQIVVSIDCEPKCTLNSIDRPEMKSLVEQSLPVRKLSTLGESGEDHSSGDSWNAATEAELNERPIEPEVVGKPKLSGKESSL
jgi:hypothetical protein